MENFTREIKAIAMSKKITCRLKTASFEKFTCAGGVRPPV
jgi:hypothetical protein